MSAPSERVRNTDRAKGTAVTDVLVEHHVLEYPGGYTRSVGPVLGRFLTRLRDGHIEGVVGSDGKVLVPPTEYDPYTAQPTGDFVEVGPSGVVTAWTWVAEPRAGKQPLDRPFAWALIRLDGADTAMLHAVVVAGPEAMRVGVRVQPRWRARRVGSIRDIEAFVPEGSEPLAVPEASPDVEPVTGIVVPIRLDYEINAGRATTRYLRRARRGQGDRPARRRLRSGVRAAEGLRPHDRRADRGRCRGRRHRDRDDLLRGQHPGSVGVGARDPLRLRGDPSRRRQHALVRARAGSARGGGPHGPAGQGGVGRRAPAERREHQVVRADRRARRSVRHLQGIRLMRDVAVISFSQNVADHDRERNEVEFIIPVIRDAVKQSGLARHDIGFTVSGSCDYLSGGPFTFVQGLDAAGAWPPVKESHVEMDAAWALYEAWVAIQVGDVDSALIYGFGKSSLGDIHEIFNLQNDPYSVMPLWPSTVDLAALQACAAIDAGVTNEAELAEISARSRTAARQTRTRSPGAYATADALLREPVTHPPLRDADLAPVTDGAAAMVIAAADVARAVNENPAWIHGLEHRVEPQSLGVRDLTRSESTRLAAEAASVGAVDVAELHTQFSHEEPLLRAALGLDVGVDVNPSGGPLGANPIMATGLIRIGEVVVPNLGRSGRARASPTQPRARACSRTSSACSKGRATDVERAEPARWGTC